MRTHNFVKKFSLPLLSLFTLFSCAGPNNVPNTTTSEEGSTSEKQEDSLSALGKVQSGSFSFDEKTNTISSTSPVSLFSLNKNIGNGTFVFEFSKKDNFSENGVLLRANNESKPTSYYFLGVDILGKLVFSKVLEGNSTYIFKENINYDFAKHFATFGVCFNEKNKSIQLYLDEAMLCSYKDEEMYSSSYTLLKANGKDTSYRGITYYEDYDLYMEDLYYYEQTSGVFSEDENGFISLMNNNLMVNKTSTFTNGTIEVTMKLAGQDKDNGIVFGLENGGHDKYWEGKDIRYYFFFVSLGGLAYLGKANYGGWQVCGTKEIPNYSNQATYNLKVIRNNNTIYCFVDDVLYIVFNDDNPCTGELFGLRAGGSNIVFSNFNVDRSKISEESDTNNFNIGSGEVKSFEGVSKTSKSKTIATVKNSDLYNGTLRTSFVPGSTLEAGIIFRATIPNGEFYEKEAGLSYYWLYILNGTVSFQRVENGEISNENKKYFPYGTSSAYEAKILLDDGDIYCYLNNRLVFHYTDENPLQGHQYGLKSEGSNLIVTEFATSSLEAPQHNEYLIFGHSYTDFWKTYKQDFHKYQDIYNIGIGGAITSDWCSEGYQKEVIAYQPKYGIYWNGINDINRNIAPKTIGDNVRRMAMEIKAAVPEFHLVLIGVCRCPIDSGRRSDIASTNNYYKQIASDLDYVTYIDTELMYCDSNGNEIASYFTDGLHPTHDAYIMCANAIMNTIK